MSQEPLSPNLHPSFLDGIVGIQFILGQFIGNIFLNFLRCKILLKVRPFNEMSVEKFEDWNFEEIAPVFFIVFISGKSVDFKGITMI